MGSGDVRRRTTGSRTSSRSLTTTDFRSTVRAARSCVSGSIASKFSAFGWHASECDGHDVEAIRSALLERAQHHEGPAVVVAHTVKGKGVSFMEDQAGWHGKAPSAEETATAMAELSTLAGRSGS